MESKLIIDELSSNWQFIDSIDIETVKRNPNYGSDHDSIGSWSVLSDDDEQSESESESESISLSVSSSVTKESQDLLIDDEQSEAESESVSLSVAVSASVTKESQDLLIETLQQLIDLPQQIVEDDDDEVLDLEPPARSEPEKPKRSDFAKIFYFYDDEAPGYGGYYEENRDDDRDDREDDVDDNLVPWNVSGKFVGRERMRKLGKRPCTKNTKAKRIGCIYNKPGCVHGKHGLGMKAY